MATLKSIKNKYLSASDGTVLGVTTNTENVSLLSFKLATADSLSKFNLVDGFSDDYNDATGVDASASTGETRNASSNYYSGSSTLSPTGGTKTVVGDYTYHLFTADGDFIVPTGGTGDIEVVMVAGGAGGAKGGRTQDAGYGGGGGAGGLLHDTALAVTAQTYAMVIGSGGDGAPYPSGAWGVNGGDSTGFGWTASGGGGGAPWASNTGSAGGSGGQGGSPAGPGGAENQSSHTGSSGTRTAYGTAGAGYSNNDHGGGAGSSGGGGGHALYIANFAAGSIGGDNGAGETPAGSYGWFGGGGGGSRTTSSYYSGAGAGMGQNDNVGENATGTWGSGGGGGGARYTGSPNGYAGGDGADGCVAIRYASDTFQLAENMTLQSNAYTAQADPTTVRVMMDEYTAVGSATLDTDIKAYASRDNGTTWTQTALTSQATIDTNHRFISGSADVSGQPAGANVKYKIETLNQSAAKDTRVYGTSMAWA